MKTRFILLVSVIFFISSVGNYAQCDFVGSWQKRLSNNTQYKWCFENISQIGIIKTPTGVISSASTINSIILSAGYWAFGEWQSEISGTGITFTYSTSDPDIIIRTKSTTGAMKTSFLSSEDEIAINYNFQYFSNDLTYANNNNYADIKANLLHEIGHVLLGFYHVNNPSSIMYAYPEVREFSTCDTERTLGMYNPLKEVTVKNSFGAGLMKIDNGSILTIPAVGEIVDDWRELSFPHSFTAQDNQQTSPATFNQKFQNWTAPVSSRNPTISVPVPTSDNPLYKANFDPEYNITFINYHSGGEVGGKIWVDDQEYNSPTSGLHAYGDDPIKGKAVNHTINGVWFTFENWSEQGGTIYEYNFNQNTHKNYLAYFEGRPTNTYRNQRFNSKVVGQPIKVYWDQHPNTNVMQYKVYRKPKYGSESCVATVSRTGTSSYTYTFTDPDMVHTNSSSTYDLYYYDVRAEYTPDGLYSDYDFKSVYAEMGGPVADDKSHEEMRQDISYKYEISNYPNPYNPTTTIYYSIKEQGNVQITVYDALGRKIADLVNEIKQPGSYDALFNGSNLTSGIYFYTMKVNDFMETKKMLLTK